MFQCSLRSNILYQAIILSRVRYVLLAFEDLTRVDAKLFLDIGASEMARMFPPNTLSAKFCPTLLPLTSAIA
jgi:hypothetical protein